MLERAAAADPSLCFLGSEVDVAASAGELFDDGRRRAKRAGEIVEGEAPDRGPFIKGFRAKVMACTAGDCMPEPDMEDGSITGDLTGERAVAGALARPYLQSMSAIS